MPDNIRRKRRRKPTERRRKPAEKKKEAGEKKKGKRMATGIMDDEDAG